MKKITMKDVAERAGVSVSAVSRVLNGSGYVAPDKRAAVISSLHGTGYQLRQVPPAPRVPLIGLILLRSLGGMFYASLTSALMESAAACGFHTMVMYSDTLDNDALMRHLEELRNYHVSGIIIGGFGDKVIRDEVRVYLRASGVPVVLIERTGGCLGFNRVLIDNESGAYQAANRLVRQGHQQILYIVRAKDTEVENARMKGFLRAMEEADGKLTYHVRHCTDTSVEIARQAAEQAFGACPGITGVMTWSDNYAAGVLQYLYRHQLRVPEDVEVIGFDDTLAPSLTPPLSSVHMPILEMAQAAMEMITENQGRVKDAFAKTVTLEPRLTLRGWE